MGTRGESEASQHKSGTSFATYVAKHSSPEQSSWPKRSCCNCVPRREFLFLASSAVLASVRGEKAQATANEKKREWRADELCYQCHGRGEQVCTFCDGTGLFVFDDSNMVEQAHECPNCLGDGTVKCPACIGLGLADINGILRNGARDGRLRMKRDGTFDILDCSAFPSCAIYGRGAPQKRQGIQASNFTSMHFLTLGRED